MQRRLWAIGIATGGDPIGQFGEGTEQAVRRFQDQRGLRVDGLCGRQTWAGLVEAGYRPGDRLLYRRNPMLRGDDVADLQRQLSGLGFDTGRVDGIFGDVTAAALSEFQRNAGLPADGIFGQATAVELTRLQSPGSVPHLVTGVREREKLRQTQQGVARTSVALGDVGDMGATSSALAHHLRQRGAKVVLLNHSDGSRQAAEANAARVELYLGLALDPGVDAVTSAYYTGYTYESPGGRHLAEIIQSRVPSALGLSNGGTRGMTLPVLRETRMPAVLCELGPPAWVVERSALLAEALAEAIEEWCSASHGAG